MTTIFKVCPATLWAEAERSGAFMGAPVDTADGFIHFSTAAQLGETLSRHFRGQDGLLLLAIDAAALGDALRYEPSRGGDLFPHLYGALPVSAVTSVRALMRGADGRHVVPLLDGAAAAFDPAAEGWTEKAAGTGFFALVGPVWTRVEEDGTRSYGFVVAEKHLNGNGVAHGGMLMTFADHMLGTTSYDSTGGHRQATIQLDTQFVAPARLGEFVVARCRVVRKTRAVSFMAATLTVGERVVATASGIWRVHAPPRAPATG